MLTPNGEHSVPRLALALPIMNESSTALTSNNMGSTQTTAVITRRESMYELVNSTICRIASLEVYRGRGQVFNISYHGFSLSDSGTIVVSMYIVTVMLMRYTHYTVAIYVNLHTDSWS